MVDAAADEVQVEVMEKAMRECTDLRNSLGDDSIDEGPAQLHEKLLKARKALDRTEYHVAHLGKLHARVSIVVDQRRGFVEDGEAEAMEKLGKADDFSTAREKNARLTLATLDLHRSLRRAERLKAECLLALDYCRTLHRGLDSTRRDLDTRIRLLTMQTSLER